jgi:hypothetical protein
MVECFNLGTVLKSHVARISQCNERSIGNNIHIQVRKYLDDLEGEYTRDFQGADDGVRRNHAKVRKDRGFYIRVNGSCWIRGQVHIH